MGTKEEIAICAAVGAIYSFAFYSVGMKEKAQAQAVAECIKTHSVNECKELFTR